MTYLEKKLPLEIIHYMATFCSFMDLYVWDRGFFFHKDYLSLHFGIQFEKTYFYHQENESCYVQCRLLHFQVYRWEMHIMMLDMATQSKQMVPIASCQDFHNLFTTSPKYPLKISKVLYHLGNVPSYGISNPYVGMWIDAMDDDGIWLEACIVNVSEESGNIKVHFKTYHEVWDTWYHKDDCAIAPLHTFTREWRSELVPGSFVQYYVGNSSWYLGVVEIIQHDLLKVYPVQAPFLEGTWIHRTSECLRYPHFQSEMYILHVIRHRQKGLSTSLPLMLEICPLSNYHRLYRTISDMCVS